jgi:hypothetical protein
LLTARALCAISLVLDDFTLDNRNSYPGITPVGGPVSDYDIWQKWIAALYL